MGKNRRKNGKNRNRKKNRKTKREKKKNNNNILRSKDAIKLAFDRRYIEDQYQEPTLNYIYIIKPCTQAKHGISKSLKVNHYSCLLIMRMVSCTTLLKDLSLTKTREIFLYLFAHFNFKCTYVQYN